MRAGSAETADGRLQAASARGFCLRLGLLAAWRLGSEQELPQEELSKRPGQKLQTCSDLALESHSINSATGGPGPRGWRRRLHFLMGECQGHIAEERERWERTLGLSWKTQPATHLPCPGSLSSRLWYLHSKGRPTQFPIHM